jgi:Lon protease-like protein
VNRAVCERLGESVVDQPVLVDEAEAVEAIARDRHLEVVAAAGAIHDGDLGRVWKRLSEQPFKRLARHVQIVVCCARVSEIGLFPLELVLLPTERVPLHIFEERYKELIGECLDSDREFGLVLADERGLREIGTRAAVAAVLDRFSDGRLNIVVEGRERFRLLALTRGRAFHTAEIEALADEEDTADEADVERALEQFALLKELASSEAEDPDPKEGLLSFQLAARVDFGAEVKQQLLEQRSEARRLHVVAELLENAVQTMSVEREVRERASTNGKVSLD